MTASTRRLIGATRAIVLAKELGDVETRVHALNNVGTALLFSDRPGGRECMDESLALALEHGFHEQAARAYTNFAEYAVVFKDFALAERVLAEGIAFDTRHDLDAWTHYLVGRQAQLRMEQGRLREAETIAEGVIGLERLTLVMRLPALTVLGRVRVRLGASDGTALLERALEDALATGEPQNINPSASGSPRRRGLPKTLRPATRNSLHWPRRTSAGSIRGSSASLLSGGGGAECRNRSQSRRNESPTARSAELRGDHLVAADEWARLGLPYEAGLALLQVRGEETGTALARAVSTFESIDARPAATLARALARRLGLSATLPKVRRGAYAAALHHPLGLTRNEQRVLRLIAEGLGNRDIARRLVRSPRTIEHHVSAVLGKFNATSRMDVVLRLRSEPWLLTVEEAVSTIEN